MNTRKVISDSMEVIRNAAMVTMSALEGMLSEPDLPASNREAIEAILADYHDCSTMKEFDSEGVYGRVHRALRGLASE